MIQFLFGILDLFAGGYLLFSLFLNLSNEFMIILAIIIILKGLLFIKSLDIASILDILSGIFIIISSLFQIEDIFNIIISIYLIQKGILSFRLG